MLSGEHAELYGENDDGEVTWRDSAVVFLWASGVFVVLAACLQTVVMSADPGGWGLTALRLLQTVLVGCTVLILIWVAQKWLALRQAYYNRVRWLKAAEVDAAQRELEQELTTEKLFALNRKQLDEYHNLSVRHASIAFRNATITSLIAFAVLVAGAVLSVRQASESGRYVTAGLAALASLMTTFISRNFFRSWRQTTTELREYYAEPIRTSKLLALERLARKKGNGGWAISEEYRRLLVERLLDDFLPANGTSPNGTPPNGADGGQPAGLGDGAKVPA